ncbi:MAG: hypothetical protein JWM99_1829 [Verrucomicrobiales bacterium]|nr:hypothetical protein [Verrucomicrobiales bacterium]
MIQLKSFRVLAIALLALGFTSPPKELWWSLKPLVRPATPHIQENSAGSKNPIDTFILAKLAEKGIAPSPEADRRTLIRRLSFDLTGLPPTAQDVDQFFADQSPEAYQRVVDRLLDSPQYGERWARHWLDVVHYGDTHGYDKDKPRPNAWPYRDYVIRSFNRDKPYGRFVEEQLAGDVLFPDTRDGIEALGFIAAGPWDAIGHTEVPETKTDGMIARHLDRDDMVATTINTFVSMTVQCAQCHNHKFDPIPTEDYYNLQSVFAAVDRTDKEYDGDPAIRHKRAALKDEFRQLMTREKSLEAAINQAGGTELAELRKKLDEAAQSAKNGTHPEFGYHSAIETTPAAAKWVQIDLGSARSLAKITLAPCSDDFGGIGDGFGFPVRYKLEIGNDPEFKKDSKIVLDQTAADFPNPGIKLQTVSFTPESVRYVRMTATRLARRSGDFIFALAELEAFDPAGKNVARGAGVTALDSTEAPVRWAKQNLVDGIYPGLHIKTTDSELAEFKKNYDKAFEHLIGAEVRRDWFDTTNSLVHLKSSLESLPKPSLVYAGAIHNGSGAFRGTGPDDGKPRPIFVLGRGDVRRPGKEAHPGALSCVTNEPSRFVLPDGATEGGRRAALAEWITNEGNPLTWRSIVNRVWQYHFGRALVESPNDFGRMGRLPTHPELLDWLAVEFRDQGQSLKKLHKLIVTSSTYKQTSTVTPDHAEAVRSDSDNHLLWRMNRRKLEAEAVRDSILMVSGQLNPKMYGPGFQDFVIDKPEHSPHYEYDRYDPNDAQSHRRSIYRFIVRSQPQPFMTALDCADPSMLVEKRSESVSPLQALALLNDGFIMAMAGDFAVRLNAQCADLGPEIETAFRISLSRPPNPQEKNALIDFAQKDGLANTCRLIFNLNEFVFID